MSARVALQGHLLRLLLPEADATMPSTRGGRIRVLRVASALSEPPPKPAVRQCKSLLLVPKIGKIIQELLEVELDRERKCFAHVRELEVATLVGLGLLGFGWACSFDLDDASVRADLLEWFEEDARGLTDDADVGVLRSCLVFVFCDPKAVLVCFQFDCWQEELFGRTPVVGKERPKGILSCILLGAHGRKDLQPLVVAADVQLLP